MPSRRTSASNNQDNEPRRTLRRSKRLKTDQSEDTVVRSVNTQGTPTSFAVAPFGNNLDTAAASVAPSGNHTRNTSSSSIGLPPRQETSNLTLRARGRKRDHSDSESSAASRKKGRTGRVSLDPHKDTRKISEASPHVNVKQASTITPVNSVQTRPRTEKEVSLGQSTASLLRNHDTESRSSSTSSSTALSARLQRQALPDGVVDLYPSKQDSSKRGTCKQRYCTSKSLTEAFLSTYGYEYYQGLKDQEHDDDVSSATSNHTCSTTTESNSLDLSSLTETPRRSHHFVAPSSFLANQQRPPVLGSSSLAGELECLDRQPHLSPKMRAILMDWLIELSEEFRFTPMTLQLAVALVDKCLACGPPTLQEEFSTSFFTVKREMLQCVGWYVLCVSVCACVRVCVSMVCFFELFTCNYSCFSACMWIASKYEEVEPPCALDFVYISDNSYTNEQIADMELTVCTALEFRLWQVTPIHFLPEFLRASCACGDPCCSAENNAVLHNMVLYLLELCLLPNELAYTHASLKAAAAVYVARVTLGIRSSGGKYWTKTLEHYTGYDLGDLEETVLTIHRYHQAAEESQLKSVFVKFRSEKYNSVSLKTVPLESDFGF